MNKKLVAIGAIIIAISIGIAASAGNDSSSNEESTKQENPQDVEPKADIIMPTKVSRPGCEETDRCYIPSKIVIKQGQTVTWLNEDSAFHSVTSGFYDEPTDIFDSGYMDPYQIYSLPFDETGTYDYFCTLHPWMQGKVIVE